MSVSQLAQIDFACAHDVKEACEMLHDAVSKGRKVWPIAGCTDWMVERHMRGIEPDMANALAIDITRVRDLRGIDVGEDQIRIGAVETFLSIRQHVALRQRCPMLAMMASEVGATSIQARATIGGNVVTGSPAADGATALMALDATVVLASVRGERSVPLITFYTGYRASERGADELVVRFELRPPSPGALQKWRKVGTRRAQAISKVAFAGTAEVAHDGRVRRVGLAAASVADRVVPLASVRQLLLHANPAQLPHSDIERAVDQDIRPIDDIRSTARYRRHVTQALVRRFVDDVAAQAPA